MNTLTQSELKSILSYDAETGIFTWKISPNFNVKCGSVAGGTCTGGYSQIKINNCMHLAHRLAWLYSYGEWPSHGIDHINRNKKDNRLSNLRLATRHQNAANIGVIASSTSGARGVSLHTCGKWRAHYKDNGKFRHLGLFDTKEQAVAARDLYVAQIHGDYSFFNQSRL